MEYSYGEKYSIKLVLITYVLFTCLMYLPERLKYSKPLKRQSYLKYTINEQKYSRVKAIIILFASMTF